MKKDCFLTLWLLHVQYYLCQQVTHLNRLNSMVLPLVACSFSGSVNPLCLDSILQGKVQDAIQFWLVRNPCSENWWFNQIDVPGLLSNIALLLQHGDLLSDSILAQIDVDIQRGAKWWHGWSGYNLVSLAKLQIFRGLLFNDAALISEGFSAVWNQLVIMPWPPPSPSKTGAARCNSSSAASVQCIPYSCQIGGGSYLGDGIQVDSSFHQHGAQLLDGAYGVGFTTAILEFLPVADQLPWQVPAKNLDVLAVHVLDGQFRMTLSGGVWDWQTCGRGCMVSANAPRNDISPADLRFAASLYPSTSETAVRFEAFAKELSSASERNYSGIYPGNVGSFAYWRSDYVLHRRNNWTASWKGRSNRTVAARCVNSDSKMSADTGEGSTFVYRGDELGTAHQGIWPLINWQQFPGITCRQGGLDACAWAYTYDDHPTFVGSVSNDMYSGSAQMYGNHGMRAARSWLFSDDGITTVVTNVTVNTSAAVVQTTLANQRLHGDVVVVLRTGAQHTLPCQGNYSYGHLDITAVYHNHTMYAVDQLQFIMDGALSNGTFTIECGLRKGNWFRIGTYRAPAQSEVFRITYEHGWTRKPVRLHDRDSTDATDLSSFGYTVFPNVDVILSPRMEIHVGKAIHNMRPNSGREPVPALPVVTVLPFAHVLNDEAAGIAAITFWQPGGKVTVTSATHGNVLVSCKAAGLVLVHFIESSAGALSAVQVSASNPDTPGLTLQLAVEHTGTFERVSGSGCTLGVGGALVVALGDNDLSGKSTTCTLYISS
eukprot:m.729380 g.729380  ORF g.729380 m.729380 type:complete len:770 (+) comp23049_c0_seq2:496-2805(+)